MSFLSELPFLTPAECERVCAAVYGLRYGWEVRDLGAPFFTLGVASYLDAAEPGSPQLYRAKAASVNPVLEAHFGWVYERLVHTLETALEEPVRFEPRFARPGFHVFLADRSFEQAVASVHVDRQYHLLEWDADPSRPPDFSGPVSFTAPVFIPRAGAGLRTWDISLDDFREGGRARMEELLAQHAPRHHPYTVGRLVLHSGHMVHQIAPTPAITPGHHDDARITLQGHAVRCGGAWRVYW